MKNLRLQTGSRSQFLDITEQVRQAARELGVTRCAVPVYVPHPTAGVTINEHADPEVARDVIGVLDRLVPWADPAYRHNEGNTAAHVKAILTGSSARVLVEDGHLQLGTWQGIFFCEFDGPRTREVWISGD